MPVIVEFATVVLGALSQDGDLFHSVCQRRCFAGYVTTLLASQRRASSGSTASPLRRPTDPVSIASSPRLREKSRGGMSGGRSNFRRTRPPAT
jgi:hypothetical protein